ncbi:MAG: hypothetical protein LIO37_02305 [Clostridiales bacterium]|nr:hypothetical protein [Clostridiales bacterium]
MIKKNMMIRMGAMVLAGVLLICSAITAFADPAGQDGQAANSPDIEKDIDNSDVIDISKDG